MMTALWSSGTAIIRAYAKDKPWLADKMEKFQNKIIKILPDLGKIGPNDDKMFKTLVHGDCWNNNLMVRFDESKKVKVNDITS